MRMEYGAHNQNARHHIYSINHELGTIHHTLRHDVPALSRMSIALFDSTHSQLHTFAHSTNEGQPLVRYRAPISASTTLGQLAYKQTHRVINDISNSVEPTSPHSSWLLEQNHLASLTMPIMDGNQFTGMLFLDANQSGFFDSLTTDELIMRTQPIRDLVCEQSTLIEATEALGHSVRTTSLSGKKDNIEHAYRVSQYSRIIANHVAALYQLDDENIDHITRFASLHDIGKYSTLSSKQCSLWLQDWDNSTLIAGRVQQGVNLISQLANQISERKYACTTLLKDIIRYHHEYLDGSGYPFGLKHEQVPVAARIVTIANIFDALTSCRHYSESWSLIHALLELEKMVAQGQLDGNCVHSLRCNQSKVRDIMLATSLYDS
ncbi:hypothetical protein BCU70_08140 [Vibrio sp. 10N.286.49.C2]|uniref:HD domain-containing phosphohydrolase n=1 Tax=unclassified Vibrio TaxID=2614977 RepID=UPI000C817B4C|nr:MULTISPECIES: HD domain-containing phosphohydrolase [unclassified Vibrio]PMH29603.1 hypothetical protein BCU70_08140 [Vibrio sp. 10N.286.49.C2]PMH56118.1 hypothetical protein BCU66_08050 [Vibrio sp. 10N.286.49.B1]PMH81055.1 hypothetical protein BCU58_03055 [Vibrio sp. 10N.286.48.B7]